MFELRPFQKESLAALESPTHVLCISPTGSGKSLIYERIAQKGRYRILLVTPLVALARQQNEKLRALNVPVHLGAGGAGELPPPSEKSGVWIVSPESLLIDSRKKALRNWRPDVLVVDECHCLWDWGEGFRPSFNTLPELITELQIERSLWLTATLPPSARAHLLEQLPKPVTEIGRFDLPPRLSLQVERVSWIDRGDFLNRWISHRSTSGIVFVATRDAAHRVARLVEAFQLKKHSVLIYHAGMGKEERQARERQISEDAKAGKASIIIATSAFGMGMDHPHLRWAVLWQAPTSLLSLAQSIGRVGRSPDFDAEALVMWDTEDFALLEWCLGESLRRREELLAVREFLRSTGCRRNSLAKYFNCFTEPEYC